MNKYRINEIKLNPGESTELLPERIAKKINAKRLSRKKVAADELSNLRIVRRSVDARKETTFKVFTVDFDYDGKLNLPMPKNMSYEIPVIQSIWREDSIRSEGYLDETMVAYNSRPVVVGFGPCGMFCALVLARAGLKPIVLERGDDVDTRIKKVQSFWANGELDVESNVQFGEGGAGTFSDGKLNTGINDSRINFVLNTFVEAGASGDILIDGRPHIGTDVLRDVVKNIRNEIISLGGEVRFGCRVDRLVLDDKVNDAGTEIICKGVNVTRRIVAQEQKPEEKNETGEQWAEEFIPCREVVLALGHSARDTVRTLHKQGLKMEPKAFSMGVRVQHPQELIDKGTYGEYAGHPDLPPAYYKLSTKASDGRGVYSFCMCPGGEIVNAASQEGGVVTNGMSNRRRDSGFANSGILVDVRPEDYMTEEFALDGGQKESAETKNHKENESCWDPCAGMAFQEKYEKLAFINGGGNYTLPETTWGEYRDYINASSETDRASDARQVIDSLPDFVARDIAEAMPVFGKRIKGFDRDDTVIKAVEARSSSPVRIMRDRDSLECLLISGVYPGGEGAGYAGGITSAACDGIKIAEKIIERQNRRR